MFSDFPETPTVSPMPSDSPATTGNSSNTHFVTVLVVSPVVLLAAVLPCLIWCLVRTKGRKTVGLRNALLLCICFTLLKVT